MHQEEPATTEAATDASTTPAAEPAATPAADPAATPAAEPAATPAAEPASNATYPEPTADQWREWNNARRDPNYKFHK